MKSEFRVSKRGWGTRWTLCEHERSVIYASSDLRNIFKELKRIMRDRNPAKSEFKLCNHGGHWALYNYKDELIYASCGPKRAIKEGQDIMVTRIVRFHNDRRYESLCSLFFSDVKNRKRGEIFGVQADI